MSDNSLSEVLKAVPRIGTEDHSAGTLMPVSFSNRYEIKSFRNAANLLFSAHKDVFEELISILSEFEIRMSDILVGGGNKSNVAKNLEAVLHPLGWNETRISGDLLVKKSARQLNTNNKKSKFEKVETISRLENFLGRVDKRDSQTHLLLIHMWTPPMARAFLSGWVLIGCFHMSGLFVRHCDGRWP